MQFVLLAPTIALMAGGQILFKATANNGGSGLSFLFQPVFITALFVYAAATISWILTLRMMPISVAYPATALSIVVVVLVGIYAFGETINQTQIIGTVLILIGFIVLAFA